MVTRRAGRPRKTTDEVIAEVVRSREAGLTWAQVGCRVGIAPETTRKAYRAAKRAREGGVISHSPPFEPSREA